MSDAPWWPNVVWKTWVVFVCSGNYNTEELELMIAKEGIELIKKFEGYRAGAYQDSIGKWTIGFGTTDPAVAFKGNKITQEEAERWLERDIQDAEDLIDKHVKVPLTPLQRAAVCSIIYNTGPGKKGVKDGIITLAGGGPSTLLVKLNRKDYSGAALEFPRWVKAGGKVLRGLVTRRAAEQALFLAGTKSIAKAKPLDSNVEAEADGVDNRTPIHKQPAAQATVAVSAAGLIAESTDKIGAIAAYSSVFLYLFVGLVIVGLFYQLKKK